MPPRKPAAISIHMPLAGHDHFLNVALKHNMISIHVPLAGHDKISQRHSAAYGQFQSTCPLRGTTSVSALNGLTDKLISIHMPLAGHDLHGAECNK